MSSRPTQPLDSDQAFKFYAFISYSHADEAFVKKLQEKIESYRLPSSLHKIREGLPDKLHPLFRDATDLPPGQLTREIQKKLAESKFLIVVCSPRSAGSYWVGKEIEEFDRLGRHDHIIPIIIDGEVNAGDPARECFPAQLLEEVRQGLDRQLLGVSVPHDGPRKAILKVIAKMLELDPDDLIVRDQARERWRRITLTAVLSGLLLLVGAGAYSYWDYQREKVDYYADYVEQWGLPHGLFPLKPTEVAARSASYRFVSQRRKLQEVAQVDSAGRPVRSRDPEFIDRPVFQTFVYEENGGRLLEARYLDHNRNPLVRLVFSGDKYTAIDFKRANAENETLQAWLTAQTTSAAVGQFGQADPGTVRGQVQRWKVTRDEQGRITKILYRQLESEKAAKDKDGIFGQELSLDERGRIIKRLYLNAEGRNFTTQMGLAGKAYVYDGANLVEVLNFDGGNKPVLDDRQQIIAVSAFDEHGRQIQRDSLDQNRALYPDRDGIARKTWKYNASGQPVEEAYFGIDGRPWIVPDGYVGWRMAYDGHSRRKSFIGADGTATADRRGVAAITEISDDQGRVVENAYYGLDGQPLTGPGGFSRKVNGYDQHGRLIEESFFGTDGRPVVADQGYARVTRAFNEFGSITEESFWGPGGAPILNREGVAKVVNDYDERGAAETVTYFGLDGQRVSNRGGYSQLRFKTDVYGRPLTVAFYGPDDRPVISALGYARSEVVWNDQNLMDELRFYDAEGHPHDPGGGRNAGRKYQYDQEGRETASAAIDLGGQVGRMVERSEPTAVDLLAESGSVAVQPRMVDFGIFSEKVTAELVLYNLTDEKVILSRALSTQPYVLADYPDGRSLVPRGTVRLVITCDPPAGQGGRLDGTAIFLLAGLPDQPPLSIPVLGQYNVEHLAASVNPAQTPMVIPIIGYNPKNDPADPFDYTSLVVDGDATASVNPDGSKTTRIMDDRQLVIESRNFDAEGRPGARTVNAYDKQGRMTSSTTIETDGAQKIFIYNDKGQITVSTEVNPDGSSLEFRHKDDGEMEIISRDPAGNVVKNPWEVDDGR